MIDTDAWIKRADEALASSHHASNASELMQSATSLISVCYGPDSPQMKTFRETAAGILKGKEGGQHELSSHARATIRNVKSELQAGLVKNVRALVVGENIAEFLALAKEVLAGNSDAAKNVGAVLVAASFEDLIRRMGAEFAGVADRPDLQQVIGLLKQKDVLKGGEPTTALGYLKFRNDSLHADWSKVELSQIYSCVSFIEQLLLKHFS